MKKFLSFAALAAMCVSTFTACSDDDTPAPTPTPVTVTDGLFIINAGNSSAQIDGSLTFISKDGNVVQNAFSTANGRSLGNTPNDAIVHGSKLYIAVTGENTIEVIDRNTLKSTQISTTKLMGDDKGKQPRRLLAGGKYVFVSTFDGYVAQIDTTDYTLANRKHLRIDILSSKLKGKSRIALEIFVLTVWCGFSIFLGIQGVKLVSVVVKTGQLSTAMQISMGWAYLCIPLAGIFMAIRLVFEIIGILRTGEIIKPELSEEEAMIEEAKKGVSM